MILFLRSQKTYNIKENIDSADSFFTTDFVYLLHAGQDLGCEGPLQLWHYEQMKLPTICQKG